MPGFLKEALQWLQKPEHFDKVVAGVVASLVVALVTWLRKGIAVAMSRLFDRVWRSSPFPAELKSYRAQLEKDTFQLRHAWMKEGQTLGDILVPVSLESQGVQSLTTVLGQALTPGEVKHVVVTGGPGSGKSVALRLAARQAWTLVPEGEDLPRIPVLITFSEYRNAGFQLLEAAVASLRTRGFRPLKKPDQGAAARRFVEQGLPAGRLLFLIDALDELGGAERVTAIERLRAELKEHASTPVILSCRTAAWHGQLRDLPNIEVRVLDFPPVSIRQFVRSWGFQAPKSAAELISVIESQPHVGTLARNPLMLTIISFLYSQPKYRLPENRAQFYDVCSRALLEEWDQHENPRRANQYDRPHKEHLLGRLAYNHLCGPRPDEDIEEAAALESLGEGMHQLGIVRSGNAKMLDEVVLNSGLLVRLPPSGLRFPHQTFLEYFAALHLLRQANPSVLLEHYWKEPARWREVVLLYCGLSTEITQSSQTVRDLLRKGSVEIALGAMVDARAVEREVMEEVLAVAREKVESNPTLELLSGLGSLSANPLSAYSDQACLMLRSLLRRVPTLGLSQALLEELLLATLRRPSEETARFVIENADQLDLQRLLPAMADRALILTTKLLSQEGLANSKKFEWIEGLRRAGAVRILYSLATSVGEPDLSLAAAVALFRTSQSEEFWECLEDPEQDAPREDSRLERDYQRWGWPFVRPKQETGKRAAVYLASRFAEATDRNGLLPFAFEDPEIHPRLAYLAQGFCLEKGYQGRGIKLTQGASPGVLRSVWRKSCSQRWMSWIRCISSEKMMRLRIGGSVLFSLSVFIWAVLACFRLGFGVSFYVGLVSVSVASASGIITYATSSDRKLLYILGGALVFPFGFAEVGDRVLSRVRAGDRRHQLACAALVSSGFLLVACLIPAPVGFRVLLAAAPLVLWEMPDIGYPPLIGGQKTKELCELLVGNDLKEKSST